eukprot:GFKZ01001249.1.p1 GENE.GFKZ01001249.1~~GFKZ01001249.1.p1  ORF type:complete len:1172 (+),score=146.29 GFKZ01001249.1:496-4011(+)
MEVVGKQAPVPQNSAWATPLNFTSNPDQPQPHSQVMHPNVPSSSDAPSPSPPPDLLSQHSPFLFSSDHLRSTNAPSMLVRSESAPTNILEENSVSLPTVPDLSDLTISTAEHPPLDRDVAPAHRPHPMNFAAAAASGVASNNPVASAPSLGHLIGAPQQKTSQRLGPSNKPPPSRSLSSVELAAAVGGVGAARVASASARVPANPMARNVSGPSSEPVLTTHNNANAVLPSSSDSVGTSAKGGLKNAVPAWHKSVFDMIQDDFPRTPAPELSSMLGRVQNASEGGQHLPSDGRSALADRRSRIHSNASLDVEADLVGGTAAAKNEIKSVLKVQDDIRPAREHPGRHHHRRSVSINWTGDMPGLGSELARSAPRTNVASSPNIHRQYTGKHNEIPPASDSAPVVGGQPVIPSSPSLPAALDASGSSSPSQSLSPPGSVNRNTIPASSPQPSLGLPLAGHHISADIASMNQNGQPLNNPYAFASTGQDGLHVGGMEDLGVHRLSDYDYLYERPESAVGSNAIASPLPAFPNHGYSSTHRNHGLGLGLGNTHNQPLANGSQYANVFPGMGIFPSPFSANTPTMTNGAGGHGYGDSIRDGLAAADNLKNMSIQMAAFITAQQQLYAAQCAHMAAISGNPGYHNSPNAFANGGLPTGQVGHTGGNAHLRSPWDVREQNAAPNRSFSRGKHHFDHYRGNSGSQVGNQKKANNMDVGHKGRSGRTRRGHRGHDDVLISGHHKFDRVGMGSGGGLGMQDGSQARSPLLEEFRATSLSIGRGSGDTGAGGAYGGGTAGHAIQGGREWQLYEIKDHVVEFATDQHGSRFIQQKLETAPAQDRDAVLKCALMDAQRLMTDVFGNYVVQKLLDHGGENAVRLIAAELNGRMLGLSLHMYGCRVVQKALEVLAGEARSSLVRELDGHVLKCIRDQNGNHVIQKCVELVEPPAVQFIVDAVQGQAVILAGHSYGCRVVQRILEHGAPGQKAPIMVEIMSCIADLIKDQYGNYVIQHVVEHGTDQERSVIMDLVRSEICQLSQHKFASNVVERCLQHGSVEERRILIEILIIGQGSPNSSPLNHLVRDQFGNYVVQRVLDVARSGQRERVVSILRAQVPAIKKYSYGKHIIARLEDQPGSASSTAFHQEHNAHVQGHGSSSGNHGEEPIPANLSHGIAHGPHDLMY